jgi:predicted Zn-dependent protease
VSVNRASANNNVYECLGFNEALPKGKASGCITIEPTSIHFQILDQSIDLPLQGLHVSMGGASNRLVFFEHPLANGWSFYTSERSVLHNTYLHGQPSVSAVLTKAKQKHRLALGLLLGVAILALALPLLMILRMDLITQVIAKKIPAEWEQKLGNATLAQYQLGKEMMENKKAEQLLQPLVKPLIAALDHSPYQYHFHIVNEGSLNAFALPGGQVMIHSTLILRADSAEELLGVLAHEINHVEQQHGLRNVIGATGIYVIAGAVFGDATGMLAVLGGAAPLLLNQSYSRRFETEADATGFALLQKAKINPSGLASFFQKMIEEEKKQLEKIEDEDNRELAKKALEFLSTHPASEDRIQNLNQLNTKANPSNEYRNLSVEFAELQTAVKQFVTQTQGENNNEE